MRLIDLTALVAILLPMSACKSGTSSPDAGPSVDAPANVVDADLTAVDAEDDDESPCEAAGGDCEEFTGGDAICIGQTLSDLSCGEGVTNVNCCLPRNDETDCEAAGGSCDPVTMDGTCGDGAMSSDLSCGDGVVGVGCCLPVEDVNPCEDAGGSCEPAPAPGGPTCGGTQRDDLSCGEMDTICCMPPAGTCEDAGGECVAVVPDACPDGIIGDAMAFTCGGGVGVMCCLPADDDE